MSRFFRSADSSSSSEDEDVNEAIDNDTESLQTAEYSDEDAVLSAGAATLSLAGQVSATNGSSQEHHKDVLLHALLEGKFLAEAPDSNPDSDSDAPQVREDARRSYQRVVSQLAPLGILPAQLADDRHAATRQKYREALDHLRQKQAHVTVPSTSRSLLTEGDGGLRRLETSSRIKHEDQPTLEDPLGRLLLPLVQRPTDYQLLSSLAVPWSIGQHASSVSRNGHHGSRLEELGVLGRGGYGIVYRAYDPLVKQAYAVKKVPISAARLHRIYVRGQAELDDILVELRTLARLHHPNIVRYHDAWVNPVEGSPAAATASSMLHSDSGTDDEDSVVNTYDEALEGAHLADDTCVVFEHSRSTHDLARDEASDVASSEVSEAFRLQRISTRSSIATASDETIENIEREPEPSMSIQSTADGPRFAQPTLALHIQMSLYPMTLADLLGNNDGSRAMVPHCYHVEPSVAITTAILDGLEYLHEEGVIHRDIKPANIFLSPTESRTSRKDCIDLRKCDECEHDSDISDGKLMIHVCIGDFGLAAVSDPRTADTAHFGPSTATPVGTAIYRPVNGALPSDPSLDIYSLGIVLFELLWKVETRMERQRCILELKEEGRYPEAFNERLGRERGPKAVACIEYMLGRGGRTPIIGELRTLLQALVNAKH